MLEFVHILRVFGKVFVTTFPAKLVVAADSLQGIIFILPLVAKYFHQFLEGILWLNHDGVLSGEYKVVAVYAFAFIAFVLWPVCVPFSVRLLESGRLRRNIILLCQAIGLYVGLPVLISIIQNPVEATVAGRSFAYNIDTPDMFLAPYFVAVTVPFLVSSNRRLVLFGIILSLSCIGAAHMASSTTFPSVWCFYAAILSLIVYLYFRFPARTTGKKETRDLRDVQKGI